MSKDTFYIEAFGKKYLLKQKQLNKSNTLKNALSGRFKETNTFPLKHTKEFEEGLDFVYGILISTGLTPKNLLASAAIADYLDVPAAKSVIKKYMKSNDEWEKVEPPIVFYRNFRWLNNFTLKKIMSETKDYNKLPEDVLKNVRAMGAKKFGDRVWIYTELKPVKIEDLGTTKNRLVKLGPGYHYLKKDNPYGNILRVTTSDGSIFYFLQGHGGSILGGRWSMGDEKDTFFESKEGDIILAEKDKNFVFSKNYKVVFETEKGKKFIVPGSSYSEYYLDKIAPEPEIDVGIKITEDGFIFNYN